MADREIKTKVVLEGEQQFRQAMTNAANAVKALNAEEKAAEASFKATGDAQAYQEEKTRILNEKLEEQRKAVEAAQKAVAKLTEQGFARNSREMQQWRTKLANAQTALSQTEGKLRNLNTAIDNTSQTMDNGAQAAADYSAQLDQIGTAINVDGAIRSIGRVTDTVQDGMRIVQNLGRQIWNLEADAASWADQIITEAQTAGLDVETYQAWQFARQMIDTSVSDILSASSQLNGRLLAENAQAAGALNAIGVAISDENGEMRASQDVFWDTIRALNAMDDATARANRAQQIFGSSYSRLMPLILQGADAWDEAVEEAREYYVLNEDQVGRLGDLDDAMTRLGAGLTTTKLEILSALAPTFEMIANAMSTAVNAFNEFLQTEEGQAALDALGTALGELLTTFLDTSPEGIRSAVQTVTGIITGLTNALNWLIQNKELVTGAITAIGVAFAVSAGIKIALDIAQGIMAAKGILDKLKGRGGEDIINTLRKFFDDMFGGGGGSGNGSGSGKKGTDGNPFGGSGTDSRNFLQVLRDVDATTRSILTVLQDEFKTGGPNDAQVVTFRESDPALQALQQLQADMHTFLDHYDTNNRDNTGPDLTTLESGVSDLGTWLNDTGTALAGDVYTIQTRTGTMALTLQNIAVDLERVAWFIENSAAISAAARARANGSSEWAALLSSGTMINPYTGDVITLNGTPVGGRSGLRASASVSSGASPGGTPSENPEARTGWTAEQYEAELELLAGYQLREYLTEETARMLYDRTDASGRLLDAAQIVPQVLAELTAYAELMGDRLPELRRRGTDGTGGDEDTGGSRERTRDELVAEMIRRIDETTQRMDGEVGLMRETLDAMHDEMRDAGNGTALDGIGESLTAIDGSIQGISDTLDAMRDTADGTETDTGGAITADVQTITGYVETIMLNVSSILSSLDAGTGPDIGALEAAAQSVDVWASQIASDVGILALGVPNLDTTAQADDIRDNVALILADIQSMSLDLAAVVDRLTQDGAEDEGGSASGNPVESRLALMDSRLTSIDEAVRLIQTAVGEIRGAAAAQQADETLADIGSAASEAADSLLLIRGYAESIRDALALPPSTASADALTELIRFIDADVRTLRNTVAGIFREIRSAGGIGADMSVLETAALSIDVWASDIASNAQVLATAVPLLDLTTQADAISDSTALISTDLSTLKTDLTDILNRLAAGSGTEEEEETSPPPAAETDVIIAGQRGNLFMELAGGDGPGRQVLDSIHQRLVIIQARLNSPLYTHVVSPVEPIAVRITGRLPTAAPAPAAEEPDTGAVEEAVEEDGSATRAEMRRNHVWVEEHVTVIPHWLEILNSEMGDLQSTMNLLLANSPYYPEGMGADWGGSLNRPAFESHSLTPDPITALADILYGQSRGGHASVNSARPGTFSPLSPTNYPRVYGEGGRVGGRQLAIIGEDGTEYVIPIGDPERALDLTMQMLGESSALRARVVDELMATTGAMAGVMRGGVALPRVPAGAALYGQPGTEGAGGGGGTGNGGVQARIYMDSREVGFMVADTVNEVMGAKVNTSRRGD